MAAQVLEQPAARGMHPGAEILSVSPVDGSVLSAARMVAPSQVPALVERARAAAPGWFELPIAGRLERLRALRRGLARRADPLARTLCRESGKPLAECYGAELIPTLEALRWLERRAPRLLAPERLRRFPRRSTLEWRPHGVVAALTPWNYPLFLAVPLLAAALAAGNTLVWKPSELALAVSGEIQALLEEAGLGGVALTATGDRSTGEALVRAGADKYFLIGSAETGRAVLEELGRRLTPAVAELSGCDPMLVLADADLDLAARAAVWSRLTGAGQTCMAPKRVLVEEAVYEPFLQRARAAVAALRVGDPEEAEVDLGPVRTPSARAAALEAVGEALRRGARLLYGGRALPGPGCFLEPTLLADCTPEMRVFREDLFAPVLAVGRVPSVEAGLELAGRSPYALTASVWTRDARRGRELARRLPGGVVSVNDVMLPAADPAVPSGGGGASGYGRMRGAAGLREMVRTRVIDEGPPGWLPRRHFFPYRAETPRLLAGWIEAREGASWRDRLRGLWSGWRAARELGRQGE
ncbi:MAG: aldehyde dehydrogenase family protein [Armatimonadota bacterium]